MPTIEIPRFKINEVQIHEIPIWKFNNPVVNYINKPVVDIPGCVRVHRNNLTSLIDNPKDEYGTYTECGNFSIPSFEPLQYNPNEFVYTQSETPQNQEQEFVQPTVEPPKYEPKKKEDEPLFIACPSSKDQRVGDYRNEFKLERVIGHKLSDNKQECITLYEDVPFKDQYIPSATQFVGVFSLALVGASAPLVLQLVRPLVKQVISKISKSKEPKSKV